MSTVYIPVTSPRSILYTPLWCCGLCLSSVFPYPTSVFGITFVFIMCETHMIKTKLSLSHCSLFFFFLVCFHVIVQYCHVTARWPVKKAPTCSGRTTSRRVLMFGCVGTIVMPTVSFMPKKSPQNATGGVCSHMRAIDWPQVTLGFFLSLDRTVSCYRPATFLYIPTAIHLYQNGWITSLAWLFNQLRPRNEPFI